MAFNSNGQVQYLILSTLKDGSKYGLEIIEAISKRTNGGYLLKKPTLYSCLTRLEKKGYISSSFWGESEFGGKRHYYSLTDAGRENLMLLDKEFANLQLTSDKNGEIEFEDEREEPQEEIISKKPIFLQQNNLFDLEQKVEEPKKVVEEKSNIVDNQIDIFTYTPKEEEKKDDAIFLPRNETLTPSQIEQNKKIYDTSSELKKYRGRRSFSDNQIEMPIEYEEKENPNDFKSKIESLKQSILQTKQNNFEQESLYTQISTNKIERPTYPTTQVEAEETKDDAVLITGPKFSHENIPYQKKITPPNLDINVSDDNLPAPIRDANLEPTYNDMMSKIQEKKKEKEIKKVPVVEEKIVTQIDTNTTFADYSSLKNYYKSYGIEFKEYRKSSVERIHNTNLINLIASTILLLLSGIGSAILFGIINTFNLLMSSSNFLYYTVPILFAVYTIFCIIKWKFSISKKASIKYGAFTNWAIFVLATIIVFVINICCGMQVENISEYLTSIILPIWALLLIFPVNFYIKKLAYKKFSK